MKLKILLLSLLLIPIITSGQGREIGWIAKFGVAGGVTPMWIIPNIEPLNEVIPAFGVDKFSESGMFALGGGGYAYIMFIENVRIGGMGFGGSTSEEVSDNNIHKKVKYSIGGGAFTLEYTLPFIKRIAVSVGAMIGGGVVEIDIYQNDGEFNWNNLWLDFSNGQSSNISRRLENAFFTITPTVNVDIPVNRFIAFRIGGGYNLALSNNWEIENGQTLSGVPSDLNGNSFFIQTGIFLGFFAF